MVEPRVKNTFKQGVVFGITGVNVKAVSAACSNILPDLADQRGNTAELMHPPVNVIGMQDGEMQSTGHGIV